MKKILVTGASGFIGRHSLPFLREFGYDIYAVSSKRQESQDIPWIQADLFNPQEVYKLMQEIQPSHLLHFAWEVTHGKLWTSAKNLDWVQASLNLFQAFSQVGGKRAVVAGTCAEYDWSTGHCIEGITPCDPFHLYGVCKTSLHKILTSFTKQVGISLAWGRIFFLYGPYEHPDRFIPMLIRKLRSQEKIPCTHGNQIRDFMHVKDVASALVTLLNSELKGALNIASGEPVSLKEIGTKIASRLGAEGLIGWGDLPTPVHEPMYLTAATSRLYNELGWKKTYDLDQGLEDILGTIIKK